MNITINISNNLITDSQLSTQLEQALKCTDRNRQTIIKGMSADEEEWKIVYRNGKDEKEARSIMMWGVWYHIDEWRIVQWLENGGADLGDVELIK